MLCAKYSYKDDIAVKQEEAREEGKQQKAIETALNMLRKEYPASEVSEMTALPLEKVLELQKQIPEKA